MGIHRLNHAVLYIRNVERSRDFYRDALGFEVINELPKAVFLRGPDSTNDHDLGLFEIGDSAGAPTAGQGTVGLYHLAWEVDTLAELQRLSTVLTDRGSLVGASDHGTTKSLYAKDPDGLEFEVVWLIPAKLLTEDDTAAAGVRPLDLSAELARFGPNEVGGVDISVAGSSDRLTAPSPRPVAT
jgi:catechol-2,3-dioxygenase